MNAGVRERARDALRAELADEVFDIVAARGLDEVTVDDIARRARISRATFFRYFGSKEEAVVVAAQSSSTDMADALRALEPCAGESVWALLRRAFQPAAEEARRQPDRLRARVRVISSTPALRARFAGRRVEQEERFAAALAERIGDPLAARAFAAAALAALDLAWRQWAADPDARLDAVLDAVFTRLAHGCTPISE